jgi:putative hydrolases of HD superfamily
MNELEQILDFFHETRKLKEIRRYGKHKSKNLKCDSSADHSWRVAVMAFVLADGLNINLDKVKAIKLALIHDLPEAECGDVDIIDVVNGTITKEEKNKNESLAIEKICGTLPKKLKEEIIGLWEEYESRLSQEAKFVRAVDKLETLTHLIEDGYKSYDSPEIIANYADDAIKNFPDLKPVLKIIKEKLRNEFEKGKFEWKTEYDDYKAI